MFSLPLGWNATPFPCSLLLPTSIWILHPVTPLGSFSSLTCIFLGPCPLVHNPFQILIVASESQKLASIYSMAWLSPCAFNSWPQFWGLPLILPTGTKWTRYFSDIYSITAFSYSIYFSTNLVRRPPWDRVSIMIIIIAIQLYLCMACLVGLVSLNLHIINILISNWM